MKTIKIIPRSYLFNAETGRSASAYGACPPGYELRTKGFTWELNSGGSITVGLCRRPVETLAEAQAVVDGAVARGFAVQVPS